jgi:hypothetical protein
MWFFKFIKNLFKSKSKSVQVQSTKEFKEYKDFKEIKENNKNNEAINNETIKSVTFKNDNGNQVNDLNNQLNHLLCNYKTFERYHLKIKNELNDKNQSLTDANKKLIDEIKVLHCDLESVYKRRIKVETDLLNKEIEIEKLNDEIQIIAHEHASQEAEINLYRSQLAELNSNNIDEMFDHNKDLGVLICNGINKDIYPKSSKEYTLEMYKKVTDNTRKVASSYGEYHFQNINYYQNDNNFIQSFKIIGKNINYITINVNGINTTSNYYIGSEDEFNFMPYKCGFLFKNAIIKLSVRADSVDSVNAVLRELPSTIVDTLHKWQILVKYQDYNKSCKKFHCYKNYAPLYEVNDINDGANDGIVLGW